MRARKADTSLEKACSAAFSNNGRQAVGVTADRCSSEYLLLRSSSVDTARAPQFQRTRALRCHLADVTLRHERSTFLARSTHPIGALTSAGQWPVRDDAESG
jgi:hypothetical protein